MKVLIFAQKMLIGSKNYEDNSDGWYRVPRARYFSNNYKKTVLITI